MRKKPKELIILAALFTIVAAAIPLQVMLTYGYTPFELGSVMAGLAPLNWVVIGVSLVHAFLVYRGSRFLLVSTFLFVTSVLWNNWVVAEVGLNAGFPAVLISSLGAVCAHIPLFSREVRRVILNPTLRWWRTAPRKRASIQAVIRPVLGGELRSMTFDISQGGAFISLDSAVVPSSFLEAVPPVFHGTGATAGRALQLLRNLKVGSRCSVRLTIDHLNVIQCGAEIVRHATAKGEYPTGFAVRFVAMDDTQRKILSGYVGERALAPMTV